MKDYLTDIVAHTHALGNIKLVKIAGDASETRLEAVSENKTFVVMAKFNKHVPEFSGIFGMPNLETLNIILNIPEYKEGSTISLHTENRDGIDVPSRLNFRNASGDFQNDYRFSTEAVVNEKMKGVKFKGARWNVNFEPTQAAIQRFKFQAQAHSDENTFIAKTENGDLKFYFGDGSTHAGNFTFQPGVQGTISKAWEWPVSTVFSILGLDGDKTINISDDGCIMIVVDSGLIKYEYIILAHTK